MKTKHRLKGIKILIVEPDPGLRSILHSAFQNEGGVMIAADSGENGLFFLENDGFDIILCEYELPGMNGLEFFDRAARLSPKSVKVLISAYGDVDPVSKAFNFGIDDLIEKPFSFTNLMDLLLKHLNNASEDDET